MTTVKIKHKQRPDLKIPWMDKTTLVVQANLISLILQDKQVFWATSF